MRHSLCSLLLVVLIACGQKDDKPVAPTAGSATPTTTQPTGSASADADIGSGSGSASGTGSAATSGGLQLCLVATQEEIEKAIGPLAGGIENPKKLAAGSDGVTGCEWQLANHVVTARALGSGDFALGMKGTTEIAGLGEKAYFTDKVVVVKVAGKPFVLEVNANAGETNPDVVTARALAKVIVSNLK